MVKLMLFALSGTEMKQTEAEGFWVGMGCFTAYGIYGLSSGKHTLDSYILGFYF